MQTVSVFDHGEINFTNNHWDRTYVNDGLEEVRNYLSVQPTIPNASAVITKRQLLVDNLPLIVNFRYAGDWYLWLLVLSAPGRRMGFIAEQLNFFRSHAGTTRVKMLTKQYMREIYSCLFFAKENGITNGYSKVSKRNMLTFWRFNSLGHFRSEFSLKNFLLAIRFDWLFPIRVISVLMSKSFRQLI
jgi:hypothetical protein